MGTQVDSFAALRKQTTDVWKQGLCDVRAIACASAGSLALLRERCMGKAGFIHRTELLQLEAPLRIVVISDTHSNPHEKAWEHVRAHRPQVILHAGDIGRLNVLEPYATLAPLVVVRGNIDGRGDGLPDAVDLRIEDDDGERIRIYLTHYALRGPRLRTAVLEAARSSGASMVVCGHSHVPFIGVDRGMGVFNPGSIGPRRFSLPITFGVVDVDEKGIAAHHVECETGARWSP